jgi:hypothetical protein
VVPVGAYVTAILEQRLPFLARVANPTNLFRSVLDHDADHGAAPWLVELVEKVRTPRVMREYVVAGTGPVIRPTFAEWSIRSAFGAGSESVQSRFGVR